MLLLVIFVLISSLVNSQDTTELKKVTASFNVALLNKDIGRLNNLLDANISYGHSNGWLQSKKDMVTDFETGKIEYKKIEVDKESFTITKQAVAVRSITKVEGIVNGTAFNMSLQVLQVWKKIKKQWVLIARQSVKVN
jgi:Domain of unknown function (DUF4440)